MANPFLGEIRVVGFNFAPVGWAICAGQILPISQNTALFSLLGTQYGGNGTTNFALPNLQGTVAIGQGQGPGLSSRTPGEVDGSEGVTISQFTMSTHSHRMAGTTSSATTTDPTNAVPATPFVNARIQNLYHSSQDSLEEADAVQSAGGGQPHENRQPVMAMTVIIALEGIFPSRN